MPDNTGVFSSHDLDLTFDFIGIHFNVDLKYPPIRNLFFALKNAIPIGLDTGLLSSSVWSYHLHNLGILDEALAKRGIPLLTTRGEQKNPARDYMHLSPVANALTQRVQPEIEHQYLGACLFLLHEIERRKLKKTPFKKAADSIRIVASELSSHRFFMILPDPIENPDTYIEDVKSALPSLNTDLGETAPRLKSALLVLTGSARKTKSARPNTIISTSIPSVVQVEAQGNEPVFGGNLQATFVLDVEDKFDSVPTPELFYQESLDLNQTELPDLGFEEIARQAGYWVDRNSQISKISRSVLNPLEKSRLTCYLSDSLHEQSFENSLVPALVAISYVTGLHVVPAARASMSAQGNQQVFTLDGQYIRKVWSPRPKDGDVDHAYQQQELLIAVNLEFPEIIRKWFFRHRDRLKFYSNLGSALNKEEDVIQKLVETYVANLRDRGRFQITLPRISSSLSAHLTIRFRNPVITTLLSGSLDQPAPTLMHYQSFSTEELIKAYETASHELMEL